jgi:hypothetical protein
MQWLTGVARCRVAGMAKLGKVLLAEDPVRARNWPRRVKTRAGRARTSPEEPTARMSMGSPACLLSKLDSRCRETNPFES